MKFYLLYLLISISTLLIAQDQKVIKIEFQSLSRGYFENVSISQDSLVIRKSNNRGHEESVTSSKPAKKEWKALLNDINVNSLERIPSLPSPTMKRAYDGARHSSITVYTTDTEYEHLFDDENPHETLGALMKCIAHIRDQSLKIQN